jgi:molybdopterin-guanine dinucleotide biosynthesis protein A
VRVAGLLLTGGASRRFGSAKADVQVDGERLADRTARVLAAVAEPVLEVGPGRSPLDAVHDDEPGAGPLAALVTGGAALAARAAGHLDALVVAVDLPFLDPAVLRLLADTPTAAAVVPRIEGRAQPLCARYSPEARARAASLLRAGERSLRALLVDLDVRWVDETEWGAVTTARCFVDVDTPDDARRVGLEPPG